MKRMLFVLTLTALTAGCAVTHLDPAATEVRTISAEQAKRCTFLDTVSANNMNTLSKDPQAPEFDRAFNA